VHRGKVAFLVNAAVCGRQGGDDLLGPVLLWRYFSHHRYLPLSVSSGKQLIAGWKFPLAGNEQVMEARCLGSLEPEQ